MAPVRSLVVLSIAATATAFTGSPVFHRTPLASRSGSVLHMGGATGIASTMEGKVAQVEIVKGYLDTAQMAFTIPVGGINVKEITGLRDSLPEGSTAAVVKNSLMRRAVEGTEFDVVTGEFLKGANLWFFIEEDIGATIKAYNTFIKDTNKQETHGIIRGVIDGNVVDDKQVEAIGKLPSKLELYAKIAGGINAVPTKLARVVKAPSSKLARAIKLATEEKTE